LQRKTTPPKKRFDEVDQEGRLSLTPAVLFCSSFFPWPTTHDQQHSPHIFQDNS
jgi:hypothetical protein